ncbi:MAG TPA: pyrimidine dimer DNA glycosylase/endonuclease V [Candidatus Competibacter sp.]|nr:DNA lyase [Candidatus Competibacteraceae bacterium]HRC72831.1 pyrimidine dimer DNA glycosylase/endonuclease V [Candidatus Competibacter sp.]
MRLWTLHPKYLDTKGLLALWREALLAQAVLRQQTKGYQRHPQLARFRECAAPAWQIARYLTVIYDEASRRGYHFNRQKIGPPGELESIPASLGQIEYEWDHLRAKLKLRAPDWLAGLRSVELPEIHPLFHRIPGGIAAWEIGAVITDNPTRNRS